MLSNVPGTTTRVLICDDHGLVRAGLRRLLEAASGLAATVVAEAGTAAEAIERTRAEQPDVVLLDLVLPDSSGIEAIPDLLTASPTTRILIISMQDDVTYVRRAFAAGASGYLLKEAADIDLVQAVQEVAAGRRYVHPLLGARLAATEAGTRDQTSEDRLSQREHEVLQLLALGHTNQEIARLLCISVRTAETHRAHIMQKLGLSTRAEIVRYALACGYLTGVQSPA